MIRRLGYLTLALSLLFASTSLVNGAAAAASSGQMVKAVWDATADADCKFSFGGGPLQPCVGGSVINEKMMSREEAIAAGYDFVAPTGDVRADVAALDRARQIVREKARVRGTESAPSAVVSAPLVANVGSHSTFAKLGFASVLNSADAMTASGCSPTSAYLQYTATQTANRPTIGVDIYYQYINGCNTVQVTYSNTHFVGFVDGNTWYDHTKFGTGSDDPGCYYDLPHGATTYMGGGGGETFESAVEHGCGWSVPRSYGSLSLY